MSRNTLLITIDCLRPDHVGSYGYHRPTTPNLDKLAEEGVRMERTFSGGPSTPPSFNTLFTSTYPFSGTGYSPLPVEKRTLAEVLQENGIATAGFNSNAFLGRSYNYQRGFDHFENPFRDPKSLEKMVNGAINRANYRKMRRLSFFMEWIKITFINQDPRPYLPADEISKIAAEWMNEQKKDLFCWIHYMDAHHPYLPHDDVLREWGLRTGSGRELVRIKEYIEERQGEMDPKLIARIKDIYDSSIHFIDRSIGNLIQGLDPSKRENMNILILADHGEEFGEHGNVGHPGKLYDELIHIPLIISGPDASKGKEYHDLVSNIDIAPTILDMHGIEEEGAFMGRSLFPLVRGEAGKGRAVVISEAERTGKIVLKHNQDERIVSARTDRWKLIRNEKGDMLELYDLSSDWGEKKNLAGKGEEVEKELNALLDLHLKGQMSERTGSEKNKLKSILKSVKLQ